MRCLVDMDTIQIEITNACPLNCANCTRFTHHVKKPFFMTFEQFKKAVDSMVGYPKMTGIMGGEPLLHPEFEKMCNYLHSQIPPRQTGLWTCLPSGKEHYRDVIVETFGNIFINDHSRDDIMHHPFLVSAAEIKDLDGWVKWNMIDKCWAQHSWSASINPHGAFFCEIAASLSMLLHDKKDGWPVDSGWWVRTTKDFKEQIEAYCMLCGGAMPLKKRVSTSIKDEISPNMVQRLSFSPKIKRGEYDVSDCEICQDDSQMASYKDPTYREKITAKYGMFTMQNDLNFLTPYLSKSWKKKEVKNNDMEQQQAS
jgi:Radical SAM superfamily